ncbi:ADP-dependent phosphofructokinase/glucokinase [Leifsonia shinshuensis]|uniref:ADP-dependent phosphofructokinase/glucokinase n=1 Tax=Leifsonia shinshuensis TaxID=150026 RepID=A0A853CXZ4_9MICO|nr:ADP-dependent phosphofructokinase/glucokinase [Leifsonia shinshuensis]
MWDGELLTALAAAYGLGVANCDPELPIVDERSLVAVILGHARARRGGERFVAVPDVIGTFSARHERVVTIGGTCVRAGLIMRELGVRSTTVLVAIDETFLSLYPADCDYLLSDREARLTPHLIVQLPAAGRVPVADGEIVIDRPNRLIFVNDPPQTLMELSPDLGQALEAAEVLLISGFNAMTEAGLLRARLDSLERAARSLPAGALIFYEDAGYHSDEIRAVALAGLTPLIDVHSMNEDELQVHLARDVDLLDPEDVLRAVADLHLLFPGPTLVIHTRHWALASGPLAPRLETALAGGIRAASARYLHGDGVTADDVARLESEAVPQAHRTVAEAIAASDPASIRCVPAYILHAENPTTIGLGDCFVGGLLAGLPVGEREGAR